jgi:ATP-dependent Clp protease adapter protein ClpS
MGVVGRYMFEVAELYYASLRENGLMVEMVPVEEE